MAAAAITQVSVVNNPAPYHEQIILEVQYECFQALKDDLEWKVIYVGSAESEEHDQVLDSAFVGPVFPGTYKFRMEAPAPDPSRIPRDDLVGVTALLLTCSYKGAEFVRVGYYVNNEYTEAELLERESPPDPPLVDRLTRSILADHPRVTKFPIDFDDEPTNTNQENVEPQGGSGEQQPQQHANIMQANGNGTAAMEEDADAEKAANMMTDEFS